MLFNKVTKEHILQGITDFEEKGLPIGFGPSSTYDLVHEGKKYPPKAIMAYSNYHAEGRTIERYFKGGEGTDCFNALERNGFTIIKKMPMIDLIKDFLEQAKTDNLKTKHYLKNYNGLKVKVSFGAGNAARIPWIALLKEPNKVQDGIYPVFLYYKEIEKLVLAYGVSETNTSDHTWNNDYAESIENWYYQNFQKSPERYGDSKIKAVYDINSLDFEKIQIDIDDLIKAYELLNFDKNMVKEDSENYASGKIEKYLIEFSEVADEWFQKQDWFQERYDFYKNFYAKENLEKAEWTDFQAMGNHIHSFNSMAIAKGNALGRMNLPIEEYRRIFLYIISGDDPINVTINNLYKKYDGTAYLPYFSDSSTSELIAYAYPEKYVTYNRRDEKALEILGLKLDKVKAEKFGNKFLRYNELLQPVLEKYKSIVGQRTDTTPQLELDQFFSWLYENKKSDEPIRDLIKRYKTLIKSKGLEDEKYKWEFIRDYKGRPNFDNNILEETKSIKFGNLLYHLSLACLQDIAKIYGPDLILEFEALNDESVDLDERMLAYKKNTLKLYRTLNNTKESHHQDERTVSVFLTLKNPVEHTLYKSSYYSDYCNYLGIKVAKPNHKYSHYLELVKDLAEDYLSKDKELINMVKAELGDLVDEDPNYLLLAQDVLYQMLEQNMVNESNNFADALKHFNEDELNTYFGFLDEIITHLKLKMGDERVVYTCGDNYLNLNIGQRFVWRLEPPEKVKFRIMTKDKLEDNYGKFDGSVEHYYTKFNDIKILDKTRVSCFEAIDLELARTVRSGYRKFNNEDFERTVFDKTFRAQFFKTEIMIENNTSLNRILFGPPGTGKTYNTINQALKIVDPDFYKANHENRENLNKRFKDLLIKKWDETKGQIAFCTFHQSFGYEDFVEGIKPETNDGNVTYDIQNGIFKNICQLADSNLSTLKVRKEGKLSWDEDRFKHARFSKLSLGDSQKHEDREIYEYCRDHNCIAIGFGDDMDFSGFTESEIKERFDDLGYKESSSQMLNYFIHSLKIGNYVMISNGNQYVRALGKVTGDYEYNQIAPIRYDHFRTVEWIFTDENIPIEEIYKVGMSQRTIYKMDENKLKPEFFINKDQQQINSKNQEKNYVLIVDEINRGNVSSIFGELITLIEPDKRAGRDEELEVLLPYSKSPFKVPHNIYIIGTMNTADKSIEALDTALRRRFSFIEMPPKPKLIETEGRSGEVNGVVDGINLKKLLITINKRIEKLIDKDHKIGHSYFLKVNSKSKLIHCFKNEVIPLLEEYFFGDYGKIGLILGNSFITKNETDDFEFAEFEGYDADVSSDLKERSVYKIANSKDWDFNTI